jgi:hypothetical protein
MFPLTRPFRQGIATAILVFATVVPTAFVALWAWRINRPGHIRDVEIELGRTLGMQVTLDAVRYPRPGEVEYQGIVLRREEPRGRGLAEIARAQAVRLVRSDRELTLHAEGLKISGESPKQTLALVGSMLPRSADLHFERINLTAPECEVDLGQDDLEYRVHDLAGEFLVDRVRPALRVAYRLAESAARTRCELMLSRDRAADPVRTSLVFKTLEGPPLPARVLGAFFKTGEWLGPRARMNGTLTLSQSGAGEWEGEFQGDLLDVDLVTLVGKQFPRHHLSGLARVALHQARWGERPGQGPGWLQARGELLAGQGNIGIDLLTSLAREMKFRLSPRVSRVDPRKTELEFRALGLEFDMRSNGEIHLAGALGPEFSPDTVLAGPTAPLAFAPNGTAGVHGLIKTLFPVADSSPGVLVPLTTESRVLLCLPIAAEGSTASGRTLGGN